MNTFNVKWIFQKKKKKVLDHRATLYNKKSKK